MKQISIIILVVFIFTAFLSCKKQQEMAAITGKWSIVNDSTIGGVGPFIKNQNYIGTAGDYFDFRSDGFLYIKEGAKLDTCSYKFSSENKIVISTFGLTFNGVPAPSDISISSHAASIHAPNVINPGGYYERFVNLTR